MKKSLQDHQHKSQVHGISEGFREDLHEQNIVYDIFWFVQSLISLLIRKHNTQIKNEKQASKPLSWTMGVRRGQLNPNVSIFQKSAQFSYERNFLNERKFCKIWWHFIVLKIDIEWKMSAMCQRLCQWFLYQMSAFPDQNGKNRNLMGRTLIEVCRQVGRVVYDILLQCASGQRSELEVNATFELIEIGFLTRYATLSK